MPHHPLKVGSQQFKVRDISKSVKKYIKAFSIDRPLPSTRALALYAVNQLACSDVANTYLICPIPTVLARVKTRCIHFEKIQETLIHTGPEKG